MRMLAFDLYCPMSNIETLLEEIKALKAYIKELENKVKGNYIPASDI